MARETLQDWAQRFADDLVVDGEAVALDRVLRKHLDSLTLFRSQGLNWGSIARAVAKAGGRRSDGQPFSEDQIRGSVSRLVRAGRKHETATPRRHFRGKESPDELTSQQKKPPDQGRPRGDMQKALTPLPRRPSSPASVSKSGDMEISADDLAVVLARIKRS
ncbi:hypothetical protein [Fulvimarina sp. MAC8]|uniref:hypothetical protein n=1 Tax=Fulvimarina sp. MAC8 TaxID=3162874 RepID=UPI0032ED898A